MRLIGLVIMLLCGMQAAAQRVEIAVLGGGQFPQTSLASTEYQRSPAVQANFGYRIAHVPLVAAYAEVPVVFGLNAGITSGITALPQNYNALYVTPGLKLKFASSFPISPFLAGGVGYARLKSSSTLANGTPNPTPVNNTSVFDIGGGVDWKIAPFMSFRVEVRDFYTGLPNSTGLTGRKHSLLPGGGLVLRF